MRIALQQVASAYRPCWPNAKANLNAGTSCNLCHEAVGIRRKNLRMQVQPLRVSCTRLITSAVLHLAPRALTALIGWFRTSETKSDVSSSVSSEVTARIRLRESEKLELITMSATTVDAPLCGAVTKPSRTAVQNASIGRSLCRGAYLAFYRAYGFYRRGPRNRPAVDGFRYGRDAP